MAKAKTKYQCPQGIYARYNDYYKALRAIRGNPDRYVFKCPACPYHHTGRYGRTGRD